MWDDEINKKLVFEGWTVIRFWGEDIKKHTDECVKVVEEAIWNEKMDVGDSTSFVDFIWSTYESSKSIK